MRDERHVDVDRVPAPDVLAELPDRLEEWQRLDVADRAADLDEDDVVVARDAADAVLDLVRDVRDDLDGLAEVVAAPFLLDHGQVDLPGRDAVRLARDRRGEALVVAEVEVRLGAVVRDVDLAVLKRRHRAGIHVEVRVELLQRDLESPRLEERAHRGRRDALAEAGNHAAGDEDVLGSHANLRWRTVRFALIFFEGDTEAADGPGPLSRVAPAPDPFSSKKSLLASSSVSTPIESLAASSTAIAIPAARARSCSRLSARSSACGGSDVQRLRASLR